MVELYYSTKLALAAENCHGPQDMVPLLLNGRTLPSALYDTRPTHATRLCACPLCIGYTCDHSTFRSEMWFAPSKAQLKLDWSILAFFPTVPTGTKLTINTDVQHSQRLSDRSLVKGAPRRRETFAVCFTHPLVEIRLVPIVLSSNVHGSQGLLLLCKSSCGSVSMMAAALYEVALQLMVPLASSMKPALDSTPN